MVFWIGFTLMVLNEGFVMMRHVSPFFDNLRKKVIKKLGENVWYRLHGTLDYTWIGLVTLGLIVNSNRVVHLSILLIFWFASFCIFYLPRYISNHRNRHHQKNQIHQRNQIQNWNYQNQMTMCRQMSVMQQMKHLWFLRLHLMNLRQQM